MKQAQHPFYCIPDLKKYGNKVCAGCGNILIHSHDVVYGVFCIYKVIKYCANYDFYCNDVIIKKIFINVYS